MTIEHVRARGWGARRRASGGSRHSAPDFALANLRCGRLLGPALHCTGSRPELDDARQCLCKLQFLVLGHQGTADGGLPENTTVSPSATGPFHVSQEQACHWRDKRHTDERVGVLGALHEWCDDAPRQALAEGGGLTAGDMVCCFAQSG